MEKMILQDTQEFCNLKQLDTCASVLKALSPDTEREFLRIGEELNTLADICYGMTDDAVRLSSVSGFSGEQGLSDNRSFIHENIQLFAEVNGHVRKSIEALNDGDDLLVELLTQVRKLRDPLEKLHSLGKTFRVLGVGIKIESSRNQNKTHGFRILADEVADISSSVQNNCRYCIDKTDVIKREIGASRKVLNNGRPSDDRSEQAIHIILRSLEDISHKSETLATGIEERSTAMAQGIGEVVMAMQFHDITRQQLENVSNALLETYKKARSLDDTITKEQREQVALEIYTILSVQAAHLNSIYEQIGNAKKQIERGLKQAMEQARFQAKDAGTLLEIESGTGRSTVVARLEEEINNIAISLETSLVVVKNAAKVSRDVYGNVSDIGDFINKIEGIAFDVKVLAINAMVEAIKTDSAGNTLVVLAQQLSNLSHETRDGAAQSIELLRTIVEGSEKQLQYTTNLDRNSVLVDKKIAMAREYTGSILSTFQQISSLAQKMNNSSRDLASRITQLIPGITFPLVMGEKISANWQIICRTIDRMDEQYPQFLENNAEVKEMLEKLSKQYVMDRERSIHAQVAGLEGKNGKSAQNLLENDGFELVDDGIAQVGTDGKSEEFGDNVELF